MDTPTSDNQKQPPLAAEAALVSEINPERDTADSSIVQDRAQGAQAEPPRSPSQSAHIIAGVFFPPSHDRYLPLRDLIEIAITRHIGTALHALGRELGMDTHHGNGRWAIRFRKWAAQIAGDRADQAAHLARQQALSRVAGRIRQVKSAYKDDGIAQAALRAVESAIVAEFAGEEAQDA